ncbi:MAG: Rad52/Rad22 family DNA repair protein, partial [Desulfuromonadales bacterium]|nr:Rad52/Rad22 family DNA repair protein [Desulfuromonadales bacterium]
MPQKSEGAVIVEALAARFDERLYHTKSMGGTEITYVPWWAYVERLNEMFGLGWEAEVTHLESVPDAAGSTFVVAVALKVRDPETGDWISRSNVGDESGSTKGYGSTATNAYAQALKRACALYGMALDLYHKEEAESRQARAQAPSRAKEYDERDE